MPKSKKHSDRDIILSLKKDNYSTFNELFEEYGSRLYYFAIKFLKSPEESEEVVQDVFLKIWEKRKELNPNLPFKPYLFTIASNCIKKRFIKKSKEEAYKHDLAGELMDFTNSEEKNLDYKFLLERIDKLIDKMPPKRKAIFLKRKKEGEPVKKIAKDLGISEKTVENQITAATNFIRADLEKAGLSGLLFFLLFLNEHSYSDEIRQVFR